MLDNTYFKFFKLNTNFFFYNNDDTQSKNKLKRHTTEP